MPSRKLGVDTGSALPLPFMDTVIDLATQIERRRNALDVPELAGLLKMSRQKIYNLIQKGEIPSYRLLGLSGLTQLPPPFGFALRPPSACTDPSPTRLPEPGFFP